MDEMLARAMADPTSMDPSILAAALPQLQKQLSEVRHHSSRRRMLRMLTYADVC